MALKRRILPIADLRHAYGILHHARIGGHQPVHIRPVFVQARAHRARDQRAGNVRAAAWKGAHFAAPRRAVEPWNDGVFQRSKQPRKTSVSLLQIRRAVLAQANGLRRVYKRPAQTAGEEMAAQIFAPACGKFRAAAGDFLPDAAQLALHVHAQRRRHFAKARQRRCQRFVVAIPGAQEQIGNFFIAVKAPPWRGYHHKTARAVAAQDRHGLPHARSVAERGAAKFAYDHVVSSRGAEGRSPASYGPGCRRVRGDKQTAFCFIFVNLREIEGFFACMWYIPSVVGGRFARILRGPGRDNLPQNVEK